MSVIEKAEKRLQEEIRQNDLGADNGHLLAYWAAYLDGARAQKNEGAELAISALNAAERCGWLAGKIYAERRAPRQTKLGVDQPDDLQITTEDATLFRDAMAQYRSEEVQE